MKSAYLINPLSASGQFLEAKDAFAAFSCVIECIEYIADAIGSGRVRLIYDGMLENRSLIPEESFQATLNKFRGADFKGGGDAIRKWYLFTRNKSVRSVGDWVVLSLSCPSDPERDLLRGEIFEVSLSSCSDWIGFGGCDKTEKKAYLAKKEDSSIKKVSNSYTSETLKSSLPFYKQSEKHKANPYYDRVRKEHVAAMPLSEEEAQKIILLGIEHRGDIFSFHSGRDEFYRFKVTLGLEYHGFKIPVEEVPQEILLLLRPKG